MEVTFVARNTSETAFILFFLGWVMGVYWLCLCTSKGGYCWNDSGTTLDERWEGGVINPWIEALKEQYIKYIKGRQES